MAFRDVETSASVTTPTGICTTPAYVAATGDRAFIAADLTAQLPPAHDVTMWVEYSTNGGTSWNVLNNFIRSTWNDSAAAQFMSVSTHGSLALTAGASYLFRIHVENRFSAAMTVSIPCRVVVQVFRQ